MKEKHGTGLSKRLTVIHGEIWDSNLKEVILYRKEKTTDLEGEQMGKKRVKF